MEEQITIREMDNSDINAVANIHSKELRDSFLGKLGYGFINRLYKYMLAERSFKCFVAECDSKICGYIAITLDSGLFLGKIYKKHFFPLAFEIMRRSISRPVVVVRSLQIVLPNKKQDIEVKDSKTELLSIAVKSEFKARGIGKHLLNELTSFLKTIGTESIFVIVNKKNIVANKFYKSLGFKEKSQIALHGEYMNLYILKLKTAS